MSDGLTYGAAAAKTRSGTQAECKAWTEDGRVAVLAPGDITLLEPDAARLFAHFLIALADEAERAPKSRK